MRLVDAHPPELITPGRDFGRLVVGGQDNHSFLTFDVGGDRTRRALWPLYYVKGLQDRKRSSEEVSCEVVSKVDIPIPMLQHERTYRSFFFDLKPPLP